MISDVKCGDGHFSLDEERWMRLALLYGARAQGRTAENPPVGCVIISSSGQLLAVAHTGQNGRPHAEQNALDQVLHSGLEAQLKDATAFVTLEPCAHHGQTPPCADALINSGLGCVIYSIGDPDKRVSGKGHEKLAAAGLQVKKGLLADAAQKDMAGFLTAKKYGRPFVTSKIALSSDGFVSQNKHNKTSITGKTARAFVHDLRSRHDALITGIGTVMADDPQLTCRYAGRPEDSPVRIVLDSHLRLPPDSQICQTARTVPVIVFGSKNACMKRKHVLEAMGVEVLLHSPSRTDAVELDFVLQTCFERHFNSVLVEAGPVVNKAFIKAGLVDQIIEIIAPERLEDGYGGYSPSVQVNSSMVFAEQTDYIETHHSWLGTDRLIKWALCTHEKQY